jgi:hypothetical protein
MRMTFTALISLVAVGLLAACGGTSALGVAQLGSTTPVPQPAGSSTPSALGYSQCMRSHGISDFPDPNSQGQIAVDAQPGSDLDPNNPHFVAAQSACKSLDPGGGTPAQQDQNYASDLKYAHCMQAHGVAIPDPPAPGSGPGSQSNSSTSPQTGSPIDPNSPQFIAANKLCQQYLPSGGTGPSTNSGGG